MVYCLNITNSLGTNFRLQKDMSWSRCNDTSKLSQDDFQTSDSKKIIDLQIRDLEVTINNENYQIEPELGFQFGNFNQLSYELYGFRREFPTLPDFKQLKKTLINGDDSRFNCVPKPSFTD